MMWLTEGAVVLIVTVLVAAGVMFAVGRAAGRRGPAQRPSQETLEAERAFLGERSAQADGR
jgi:hypothetical protein